MRIYPIKPALKAPGSERLKLKCDDMLSSFAFKFNLRRCNVGAAELPRAGGGVHGCQAGGALIENQSDKI